MNKRIILFVIILCLIFAVVPIGTGITEGEQDSARAGSNGLTTHEPIYVNGNDDFVIGENGVVSGNGTESDPYIIENWDIDAGGANGIDIRNTDVYFIIKNCVTHDGKGNNKYGVYFYKITNGKIDDVTSYNNLYGIYLYSSSNNTISKCDVYNNSDFGICLYSSSNNNTITNCYVNNTTNRDPDNFYGCGIYLKYSSNNNVTNCTVYNNSFHGILIKANSNENNIINCTLYSNSCYGIRFDGSGGAGLDCLDCSVLNCVVYDNGAGENAWGILVDFSSHVTIDNCTVYNNSHSGIVVDIGAYVNITNCTVYNHTGQGIWIANSLGGCGDSGYSTGSCFISRCNISNNYNGIKLIRTSNNTIANCNVYNNTNGIHLDGSGSGNYDGKCDYTNITNCYIYNNSYGIRLDSSSNNNQITNSTIYNNSYGIKLNDSSNNEIHYCDIYDSTEYGIYNYNEAEYQVNATYNWLGDASGPYHSSTNPIGTGDQISDNVLYNPWLTEPCVNQPPMANFIYSPSTPATADTIQFTSTSTDSYGTIVLWSWQFGDGAISTEQNPEHRYTDDGTYYAKLTVWDDDGASDICQKVVVVSNVGPVANFTYTPDNPTDLQTVGFTDTSIDSDGVIVSWCWEFGDGNNSTLQNPEHQYTDNGMYYVNLTVTDDDDASDIIQKVISVSNVAPVADFTYTPESPATINIIQFTDISADSDGTIASWYREFGDGGTSTEQNPKHQYSTPGTYTVKLTVIDNDGASDSYSVEITVTSVVAPNNPPTLSNGSVSPLSGDLDTVFTFNVTYTDEDNDEPVYVNVSIDGFVYNMTKQNISDDNYKDGCIYEYSINLSEGFHSYSFEASDGTDINRTVTTYGIKVTEKEEQKTEGPQIIYYIILVIVIIAVEIVGSAIFLIKRKKTMNLKCPKCNTIFKVKRKKESFKVECPTCGAEGTIKPAAEKKTLPEKTVPETPTRTLRCPKCMQTFTVEEKTKPFAVKCPYCGKEGTIR